MASTLTSLPADLLRMICCALPAHDPNLDYDNNQGISALAKSTRSVPYCREFCRCCVSKLIVRDVKSVSECQEDGLAS